MTVITPQRNLVGINDADLRNETDRMLTRLAQFTSQQSINTGLFVDAVAPTPAANGATKKFTLPSSPSPALSLRLYANGLLLQQGTTADYTLLKSVITFAAAPAGGTTLIAYYRTQ